MDLVWLYGPYGGPWNWTWASNAKWMLVQGPIMDHVKSYKLYEGP